MLRDTGYSLKKMKINVKPCFARLFFFKNETFWVYLISDGERKECFTKMFSQI